MPYEILPPEDAGRYEILPPEEPQGRPFNPMLPAAGVGEAALSLGTGAISAPLSGLAGLAGAALQGPRGQGADWVGKTQEALTYQPRTQIGQGITSVVAYPFEKLAQAGDWAGQRTADRFGPAAGTAVNTAIQSLPMWITPALRKIAPGGEFPSTLAKRKALQVTNAQRDAAALAAREAGYALPPAQVNPSFTNKSLVGFAGKIKTEQDLSFGNQPITNQLVRQNFELPPDVPLTAEVLASARKVYGAAYDVVRGAGRIEPGEGYFHALDEIAAPYRRAASDFPKAKKAAVIDAVESMRVPSFDASSAVDQIMIMRDNAEAAFSAGDKGLGRAYKGIAKALEDSLDASIESNPNLPAGAIDAFREARRKIAQSYTVQKHLRPNGNVDAQALATELKKKPLTGDLKTVAEFGANFRKAAQVPEKVSSVPMSPLDMGFAATSLIASIISGRPKVALGAAAPFLRPGLRKVLGSNAYQNMMVQPPSYGPSLGSRFVALQELPGMGLLETSLAQRDQ